MTESRLERLLKLIDSAQSPAYRRLAAKQLGSLVQAQPNQARPLLKTLDHLLGSKNWDTRIACGYAIEYIFVVLPGLFSGEICEGQERNSALTDLLKEMDLPTEIRSRKALLASAGSEFDLDLTISAAERLKISRANMKKTLGFDELAGLDDLERELVKDEDLTSSQALQQQIQQQQQQQQEAAAAVDLEKLSARERIAMKRKARLRATQAPPAKQMKRSEESLTLSSSPSGAFNDNLSSAAEAFENIESDALWFCEKMKEKLLNPNWQIRHGALLGLRGVLGRGLPIISSADSSILSDSQEGWIDFLLGDILLILGLDRFGDFIGDQVVSPVKETAAQLFSLIYKRLGAEKRNCLVNRHLRALMNFESWQVRHAGLLSLKHILANVVDDVGIACQLSDRVVDLLSDGDEDVRSVAADVLSSFLASGRQSSVDLERTFRTLQVLLGDLDESSPSVAPVLDLLGQLVVLNASFSVNSGLLLPFLRHASTKVRKQLIKVLGAMLLTDVEEVQTVLIQLIQSMAVELDREISDSALSLTLDLITISPESSEKLPEKALINLFEIATCVLGQPYAVANFTFLNEANQPAGHDLAFKKADMMLISETEGVLQRINVSRALSALISSSVASCLQVYREKLKSSAWVIQHLIYRWIFGIEHEGKLSFITFNELSGVSLNYLSEFNRFAQLVGGSALSNLDVEVMRRCIEEFNTRTEKSVEALNQLSVLESVRSQYEIENSKQRARFRCCTEGNYRAFLDALKIETNPRLQEYFAKEFARELSKNVEEVLSLDLMAELGELMGLERLVDPGEEVISVQKNWIEYNRPADSLWRSGSFIFRELCGSAVCVGKALTVFTLSRTNFNWFIPLAWGVDKDERVARVLVENVDWPALQVESFNDSFGVACAAFAFALLVRNELKLSKVSGSLEAFLHRQLFVDEAWRVFPMILELLNRTLECVSIRQVIFRIVPVLLKRTLMDINDSEGLTRKFASLTFSQLIKIAPLASVDAGESWKLSAETEELIVKCREFLDQLQGPSTNLPDFVPPCKLNVELRPYQQAGLNWLAFLRRFNLHGALCDDMGLGKTLQTLSILASDHFEFKANNKCEADGEFLRSLIVCPASLTGHWEAEVKQYCPTLSGSILIYVGSAAVRHAHLSKSLGAAEIVITSYDVLRSDSDHFTGLKWNYCVLDEGHLIKNPKTKLYAAVRGIKAKRRLLLSGTPIQNNLLELWALFDFLLPGYLGSEKEFTDRYAKPILILQHQQSITGNTSNNNSNSNNTAAMDGSIGKWTQKDFDEADAKLQSLHKQVLPFILRRMKEDVLSDLPPKIIQDYKCPMSAVQKILYDDLLRGSSVRQEISNFVKEKLGDDKEEEGGLGIEVEELDNVDSTANSTTSSNNNNYYNSRPIHVFQVLQYLRKLCIHPLLVRDQWSEEQREAVEGELNRNNLKMNDLRVAPKFQMLKELLVECGLGGGNGEDEEEEFGGSAGHRVLIFAQQKSTLDLIEQLVFKPHLPGLSYLRLDGGVEAASRYPIVSKFNTDMTIDVLLLTTHVGGLGLNLTTADTVIFMDPDWNPMKDLQAMDRAHRLGQKRVVNVYRLLLQDTLEDRIMSLQRWKTHVAGTVISQQNSEAVNRDYLLDLFDNNEEGGEGRPVAVNKSRKKTKRVPLKNLIDNDGDGDAAVDDNDDEELASREAEYEREFN